MIIHGPDLISAYTYRSLKAVNISEMCARMFVKLTPVVIVLLLIIGTFGNAVLAWKMKNIYL